jgi:hypothetical protein
VVSAVSPDAKIVLLSAVKEFDSDVWSVDDFR